jgi:hypothetical protein
VNAQRETGAATQCASAVLMVRPGTLRLQCRDRADHRFQVPGSAADVTTVARAQFDAFAGRAGWPRASRCACAEDSAEPRKPDAVFPNNWVSFHADGTVVLYPMQAASRRVERRAEIIEAVVRETGLRRSPYRRSHPPRKVGRFLEGTGSLVLDHVARVAYACRSPRTDETVAREWAQQLGYQLENVLGTRFARASPSTTPTWS